MDGKLLGLSIVIFAFAFAEASSSPDNFYATRYGKRYGADGNWSRSYSKGRRSSMSDNLFFGSRYGKRSRSVTPHDTNSLEEDEVKPWLTKIKLPSGGSPLEWDQFLCQMTPFRHLRQCLLDKDRLQHVNL